MSEKRFFTKINKNGRNVIIDKECHIEIIDLTLACDVLNRLDLKLKTYNEQLGEQQATIQRLEEELKLEQDFASRWQKESEMLAKENEQLRQELSDCEKFRYQVFKEMEKIIEEKKNDNGGFQVWEVPPIPQGKRISFTTNNDGDGV